MEELDAYRRLSVQSGGVTADAYSRGEDGDGIEDEDEELLPVAVVINHIIRSIEHNEDLGVAAAYSILCTEGVDGLAVQLQEAFEERERVRKGLIYVDPAFRVLREERQQEVMRFMQLVRNGRRAEAEEMLRADSTLADARDWGGTAPLHVSVILKDHDLSRLLIQHGASLSQADATGSAAAAYASKKDPLVGEQLRLLESSLREPRSLSEAERRFETFRRAACKGELDTLSALHELDGGLVFMQDERSQTALIAACASCQYDAAKLLLFFGSDWKHKSWLGGLQAFPAQFLPDKLKRRELKEYAWWQTPRGRREAERLRVLNELNEERAREAGDTFSMTVEESRTRRLLANEATTRELCRSMALTAADRAFRLARRSAVRWLVKEMEEEEERRRKAAVLARRLARDEALRLKMEQRRRRFLLFGEALCASARAERRERVRAEIRSRRERAEAEAAERERLALLEELRLRRETELRAMQDQAIEEWEQLQTELERKRWEAFMARRPNRLLQYNRMRNGAATVSSSNAFLLEKRAFLPQGGSRDLASPTSSSRRAAKRG